MPNKRAETQRRSETTTPSESAEPYEHPADHSWNLQILLDLKESIGRLDERTSRALDEVLLLRSDVKTLPTRTAFWAGVSLIVFVFGIIAVAYYDGVTAQISALETRVSTLETRIAPMPSASPH